MGYVFSYDGKSRLDIDKSIFDTIGEAYDRIANCSIVRPMHGPIARIRMK